MTTNRYTPLFWAAIICITAACSSLVLRAQHQLTITSDAPIRVEGDDQIIGFPPEPPEITYVGEDDRWLAVDVLGRYWDNGVEANVRGNAHYHYAALTALAEECAKRAGCDPAPFSTFWDASADEWLLAFYQYKIANCRGGGDRQCILRRQVPLGQNKFSCQMYSGDGLVRAVLRELRDSFPEDFKKLEDGRCPPRAAAKVFGRDETPSDGPFPDPFFNMAITSKREW